MTDTAVFDLATDAAHRVKPSGIPRHRILGVPLSAINYDLAIQQIDAWIEDSRHEFVTVTGVHGVMECQRDAELQAIFNDAGMVTPDGMPMVWLTRRAGFDHVSRVYGPTLMLKVCEHSVAQGYRHFLYGGNDGVAEELKAEMKRRFSGIQIVGTYCPPFRQLTEAEDEDVVSMINESAADIVWVGLSTPKQERWMAAHKNRINANVMLGVGAAFDFHTGRVKQAPGWMQKNGLEWLFRVIQEPRRLWRRYLVNNSMFVFSLLMNRMGWGA